MQRSELDVTLRMSGLSGMYSFCAAVLLSLCTGIVIDTLNDKLSLRLDASNREASEDTLAGAGGDGRVGWQGGMDRALLSPGGGVREGSVQERHAGRSEERRALVPLSATSALHVGLVLLQLCVAASALFVPLFRRNVPGSLPAFLRAHSIDFDATFSVVDVWILSSKGGGLDYLMVATFGIFLVLGPLIRPVSLLVLMLLPMTRRSQASLHALSKYVSVFYAYEVLLVAVPLISTAIGPLSKDLINGDTPVIGDAVCTPLSAKFNRPGDHRCLEIAVTAASGYWVVVAAVGLYLLSGVEGSPTHKYVHFLIYPQDIPPPSCRSRR